MIRVMNNFVVINRCLKRTKLKGRCYCCVFNSLIKSVEFQLVLSKVRLGRTLRVLRPANTNRRLSYIDYSLSHSISGGDDLGIRLKVTLCRYQINQLLGQINVGVLQRT